MASSASDMDTECPVCHEDFTDARFLPCFHVACRKCILSWLLAGGQGGCPLCRSPIMPAPTSTSQSRQETPANIVDKLPTDFVTMALVNSKQELSINLVCGVCDGVSEAGASYCLDCSVKLCTSCAKVHGRLPATRDHTLEDLSKLTPGRLAASRPSPCVSHDNRPAELYCSDHCSLICLQCFPASHQACSVKPVASTATKEREALTVQAKSLRHQEKELDEQILELGRKIAEVQAHFSSQRSEVKATFDRLQQLLDKRCQAVLAELQREEDDKTSPKQAQKAALEKEKASLAVHAGSVERLVRLAPDGALLRMLEQLKARLDRLETKGKVPDISREVTLVSVAWQSEMITRLEQAIATLGQVSSQTPRAEGVQPCIVCGLKPEPVKPEAAKTTTARPVPARPAPAKPESASPAAAKPQFIRPAAAKSKTLGRRSTGAELARGLQVGDRVRRGRDWRECYGNQDGTPPGLGTVMSLTGWWAREGFVTVKWDAGVEKYYRMGYDGCYDLELA